MVSVRFSVILGKKNLGWKKGGGTPILVISQTGWKKCDIFLKASLSQKKSAFFSGKNHPVLFFCCRLCMSPCTNILQQDQTTYALSFILPSPSKTFMHLCIKEKWNLKICNSLLFDLITFSSSLNTLWCHRHSTQDSKQGRNFGILVFLMVQLKSCTT